jgi:hypothetical protein
MLIKILSKLSPGSKIYLQICFFGSLLFSACTTTSDLKNQDVDYYGDSLNRNIGNINDPDSIAYFEQKIGDKIYFEFV